MHLTGFKEVATVQCRLWAASTLGDADDVVKAWLTVSPDFFVAADFLSRSTAIINVKKGFVASANKTLAGDKLAGQRNATRYRDQ